MYSRIGPIQNGTCAATCQPHWLNAHTSGSITNSAVGAISPISHR